ncbi:putative pumilio homolog 8, chloroplastic [Corylus avellana]|uniref:putative pumilio homolog 8, chloroplastic n=1 Tax=Corylus avellana TaxID=13451 RepID=UPI00286D5496|nr:putative pumilio homolog 8, chloroplastic [Corylus avellana]
MVVFVGNHMGDWRHGDNRRRMLGNLIRPNSGFGEASTSIWANQNNPIGFNAARGGRVNGMSAENLNLNCCGVGGENYCGGCYQNSRSPGVLWIPDGINNYQDYLNWLQNTLSSRDQVTINMVVEGVIDTILLLMTDRHGHQFFNKLMESVNEYQLQLIVAKITSQPELLIHVSLTTYGSKSVKKLLKKLGKMPLTSEVISALSSGFYNLMIDLTGSSVILRCLDLADTWQNEHVLGLHDPVCTESICFLLRGSYVLLSSQKGGSHVVEKCLNSPWMDYAILDFLKWNRLSQLARDRYGNYVIQTALKATKRANSPLYERLLHILQGHFDALQSGYGRNVINLILKGVPLD